MEKIEKIVELGIDLDGMEDELFEELGTTAIAFVESPAIEESFMYFNAEGSPTCDCGENHDFSKEEDEKYEKAFEDVLAYATVNGEYTTEEDILVDLTQEEFTTIGDVVRGLGALDLLGRLNITRGAQSETYYRYQGPPAERKFCRAMLRLSNRGKIFTKPQIDAMNGLNPDFAASGQSEYSIFKWLGGKNCKHYFQKLEVFKNEEGKRVIIVADPSNEDQRLASKPWAQKMSSSEYSFKVLDEDSRLAYGPVMVPNKMILRRDGDGNPFYVYFSEETIRKMASKFLAKNNLHNTNIEHSSELISENTLVESWVSDSSMYDKSYQMGFRLPRGTWYVGYKVNDDDTWKKIKNGEVTGFSLEGDFLNRLEK
jgi:hypothetical protein